MKFSETNNNFASLIGKGALLSVCDSDGKINTMTVSWGGCGVLWGKEVCFVFVRPERYTFGFCEANEKMSLSFFGDERASTLAICGTKSGRDVDKLALCSLKASAEDGYVSFEDARLTLRLKKLYADDIKKEQFIDTASLKFYENGGFHRMYVCELV